MSAVATINPVPLPSSAELLPSPSPSPVMESDVAMQDEMKDPSSHHTESSSSSSSPPPSALTTLAPPVSSSSSSPSSPDQDVEMKTCDNAASSGPLSSSSQTLATTKSDGGTYNAFGRIVSRPYNDPALENEGLKVRWVYRAVNFLTDLFFGVDKDLDHLPEKRKSMQPVERSGKDILHSQTISVLPPDISAGYGELAWQGFDKLLYWLQHEAPENYRLNEKSRFLDIGSGFGKCVFHAKIRAKVARSVGIECIKTRHEKALESLHLLRAGFVPGLSDAKDAPSFEVRNIDSQLNGCELFEGDISVPRFHPLVYGCTHVYAFDVVFSKDTHAKILPIVEASKCQIFGCYLNPTKLALFGCTKFQLLHSIKVKTTGKQSFTCFFYAHKDRMEGNVPAASDFTNTLNLDPESDEFWEAMHAEGAKPEAYVAEALSARDNPHVMSAAAAAAASSTSSSSTSDSAQSPDSSSNNASTSPKKSAKKKSKSTASPQKEKSDSSTPKKKKKSSKEPDSDSEGESDEEPKSSKGKSSKKKQKKADASPPQSKKKSNKKDQEKDEAEEEKPQKKSHKKKEKDADDETPASDKKSHKKKVPQSQEKGTKRKNEDSEEGEKKSKASTSHKKKKPEETEVKEEVKAPVVKKISRAREFELAIAATFAPKPKSTGRSTNNSVMVKLEPVKILPKDLDDYLLNPVKPEKPLIPEKPIASEAESSDAAVDESPSKKQKLADGSASATH